MNNERVATYIFDERLSYGVFDVFACYQTWKDRDNRNVDFYDVYNKNGQCVNEGDPFYQMPTWDDIYEYYYLPSVDSHLHNPLSE